MIINYELNPPKILPKEYFTYSNLLDDIDNVKKKVNTLHEYSNCIHFTDSVLGIPRLSSITMASIIKKDNDRINISCSIRTRDRNLTSMYQSISDSILYNIESLLILLGDQPKNDLETCDLLKPSRVVNLLNSQEFKKSIKLNLSIPNKIRNINTLQKKIDAKPSPDTVKIRHILISTESRDTATASKLADSIRLAIANGSNFDSLAAKFSDDGTNGGMGVRRRSARGGNGLDHLPAHTSRWTGAGAPQPGPLGGSIHAVRHDADPAVAEPVLVLLP